MKDDDRETYLGDGLYASFNGYAVRLRAPRIGEDHVVYLEPEVFDAFLAYAKAAGFISDEIWRAL